MRTLKMAVKRGEESGDHECGGFVAQRSSQCLDRVWRGEERVETEGTRVQQIE